MLSAQNLSVNVQGSRVLRGISFEIMACELVYLVGRNGAGKTTTFRTIMGFRKPAAGAITFDGVDRAGLRPYQVARLGVPRVPRARALPRARRTRALRRRAQDGVDRARAR